MNETPSTQQIYDNEYIPYSVKWGRLTSLIGVVASFVPGVVLAVVFDIMPAFDAIVTAADVTHSKPHPEPYLAGATKAGVDPLRCIVFEDSFQGLQAGRAAGCLVVGLSTTNSAEQVAKFADTVTPSLAALSARIDELLG